MTAVGKGEIFGYRS